MSVPRGETDAPSASTDHLTGSSEKPCARTAQEKSPPGIEPRGAGDQYSSASMIVSTRVVFDASAGSSEPNCIVGSR
jgi:hypothetical protein